MEIRSSHNATQVFLWVLCVCMFVSGNGLLRYVWRGRQINLPHLGNVRPPQPYPVTLKLLDKTEHTDSRQ